MKMKKIIYTTKAPAPIGPYSQALMAGNTLYVSGQVPIDPATAELVRGDIRVQARQVMENILSVLGEAGMNYEHIVKTTIFLTDMNDFAAVNEVYGSCFTRDFPARETIQVSALPKNAIIEISVVAVKSI
jgi:2-iminobutanoate/2-iminopropanoate deaminase